jgi:hypothetical protein
MNASRMHARYLSRRAVERRANCGGKIAPLQRRQVRCACSISRTGWKKELQAESYRTGRMRDLEDVFRFISHKRVVSAYTCTEQALTLASTPSGLGALMSFVPLSSFFARARPS